MPLDLDRAAESSSEQLERGMGLAGATATNLLGMIGVGPFLTLPIMLGAMGGPHILYAWLAGALLALCDGLVYAQLAAALPGSGGSYVYLREAFRPLGLGRVLSFLYIFQVMLVGPLSISAGAVGFSTYLAKFVRLTPLEQQVAAAGLCLAMIALLYRPTVEISRMSVAMLGVVAFTVGWVILGGLARFSWRQAFTFPPEAFVWNGDLCARVGAVSLLAMYNYGGYNNVCNLGDEIRTAHRTMPRAIVLSILMVVGIYLAISTVILGTLPWREAMQSPAIASDFITRLYGPTAGHCMTGLILFVTAASLFAVLLGYSRVPYAAARDGQFFAVFGRLHPRGHFPHISLLTLGLLALPFCFLPLGRLVNWLILVQIASQFLWQCAGVMLLRRYRADLEQPFVMWLYPLPACLSLGLWFYVFLSGERTGQLFALAFLGLGLVAYQLFRGASKSG